MLIMPYQTLKILGLTIKSANYHGRLGPQWSLKKKVLFILQPKTMFVTNQSTFVTNPISHVTNQITV